MYPLLPKAMLTEFYLVVTILNKSVLLAELSERSYFGNLKFTWMEYPCRS